jgi:hypothetical protein
MASELTDKIVIARALEAWRLGIPYSDVTVASGNSCTIADAVLAALESEGYRTERDWMTNEL